MPKEHWHEGIFVAEGEKVVRRLLASSLQIKSLLITEEWLNTLENAGHVHQRVPGAFIAPKAILEEIVGYNLHQGIMGIAALPQNRSVADIVGSSTSPRLFVALDGLVNAENVGVIVRNCAAFGVDGIIVGETSSSPYLRRSVRNSMGTVFTMEVAHVSNLAASLLDLKESFGFKTLAADPNGSSELAQYSFAGDSCIVLGNEGEGIRREVLDACSIHLAIPMMNGTDSVNVGSASAIFLYAARTKMSGIPA
jgi:tRNA G18 (ribose-2'-O)-methylase SpoU